MSNRSKSRKKTPWDDIPELTDTQEFLQMHYVRRYEERHLKLIDTGEAKMINSYIPEVCPFCHTDHFVKIGFDPNGIQRYKCGCGNSFEPTTGTIFDSRRLGICEWIEYCLNIFRYVSLNADSWNNRNAISTSKYWLEKLFLTLENSQNSVVLSDTVWLDENGHLLRGLSRNQICIGVATDKKHTICFLEGYGKPNQKQSYETFKDHIAPGSTLIHDKEKLTRNLLKSCR